MSTSEAKRQKQKEAKAKKSKAAQRTSSWNILKKFLKIAIPVAIVSALLTWIIVDVVLSKKNNTADVNDSGNTTVESTEGQTQTETQGSTEGSAEGQEIPVDYSLYLSDDGKIKDVNIADYVTLADLSGMSVALSDVTPSDEDYEKAVANYMETYLDKEASTLVQNGDRISLDYVGYVDGVAFEGGDTKGQGTTLNIGSHSYIDDFEEQLIGHAPGEEVKVEVTFPENYGKEELNGKDAVFEVVINGVFKTQLPSDEYVKEHFSERGSTYEEFEASLREDLKKQNIQNYAWDYIFENSEISSYPEGYYNNLIEAYNYQYVTEFNYYNEYSKSMSGEYQWDSIYDYYQTDEEGFNEAVKEGAASQAEFYMFSQAICEKFGLEITDEDIKECVAARGYGDDGIEGLTSTYGVGYLYQSAIGDVASKYITELVEVK